MLTPADDTEVFAFRRIVGVALEDFGVRRRPRTPRPAGSHEALAPPAPAPSAVVRPIPLVAAASAACSPPVVVWHGRARRAPELQRFCEHLDARREPR